MSKLQILRILTSSAIVFTIGACSFKKDSNQTSSPKYGSQEIQSPSQFCEKNANESAFEESELLPLSTSPREDDLCRAVAQLKQKAEKGTLVPKDIIVYNNILKSSLALALGDDPATREVRFRLFSSWATNFASGHSGADLQTLIRLNNISSNPNNNVQVVEKNFAEEKIYLFAHTDHLSHEDFFVYFNAISNKVTHLNICRDISISLALKTKRLSTHVSSIIAACGATYSTGDIVAFRQYLNVPVSESELLFFESAINANLFKSSPENLDILKIGSPIAQAVKMNDPNLFRMAAQAFNNSGRILYSLSHAKEIDYNLEIFIRDNSRSIHPAIRSLWTPEEVIAALRHPQSALLFNLLSENDLIPNKEQTEKILKRIIELRRTGKSHLIQQSSLESLFRLIRSNTRTGFRSLFKDLHIADEEIRLIVDRRATSIRIAELLGVRLDFGKIYVKTSTAGIPEFSQTSNENFYLTSEFFRMVFVSRIEDTQAQSIGVGYESESSDEYHISINDILTTPIAEMSQKIQCIPKNSMNRCSPPTDAIEESLTALAIYAKRKHQLTLPNSQ